MSESKYCNACNTEKQISEFPPNASMADGVQSRCSPCYSRYQRDYYRKRIATDNEYRERKARTRKAGRQKYRLEAALWLTEYHKSHPCVECGEGSPVLLEFDHLPGVEKIANVSELIRHQKPADAVLAEIAKCEVRCVTCHRIKTAKDHGWIWFDDEYLNAVE